MQRTPDLLRLQQWLWRALRHAQQIPLPQPYAHLLQRAHLFVPLNPFGQYLTTQIAANAADRLHELPLDRIPVQVADEMLVDLDELRLQLGPESQPRVTDAQIINGDPEAHAAIVLHRCPRQALMIKRMLLGQLDHDGLKRNPQLAQQISGKTMLMIGRAEQRCGNVEKQQPAQLQFGKPDQRALAAQQLQLQLVTVADGRLKQAGRSMQQAVVGPANQRFVPDDRTLAQVDDGLKHGLKLFQTQYPFQLGPLGCRQRGV